MPDGDTEPNAGPVAVRLLLHRVAAELEQLQQGVALVEDAVGDLIANQKPPMANLKFKELQFIDNLGQSLAGLREFLVGLGPDIPGEWRLDPTAAATCLRMHSLTTRLLGDETSPQEPALTDPRKLADDHLANGPIRPRQPAKSSGVTTG